MYKINYRLDELIAKIIMVMSCYGLDWILFLVSYMSQISELLN